MKREYLNPEISFLIFDEEEILTTSFRQMTSKELNEANAEGIVSVKMEDIMIGGTWN